MRRGFTLSMAVVALSLGACDKANDVTAIKHDVAEARSRLEVSEAKVAALQKELFQVEQGARAFNDRLLRLEVAKTEQAVKTINAKESASKESASLEFINAAISQCVREVRSRSGNILDDPSGFDAYYNPSTRRVEDNVQYNNQRNARFQFQRCMSDKGLPIK